jgi:hypothetical protein
MKVASIIIPGLAAAGLAAYALSTHIAMGSGSDAADTVVVTLPQKKSDPVAKTVTATNETSNKSTAMVPPADRAGLSREIQRELKRVGCYDGEVSGNWTTSARMAMKTFTDRVNASLPIDQPDYILLTLVQRHQGRACGSDCPSGQSLGENGRCLPSAVLAKAGKGSGEADGKTGERIVTNSTSATSSTSLSPTAGIGDDVRAPSVRSSSSLVTSKSEVKSVPSEMREEQTRMAAANKADTDAADDERRGSRRSARSDGPVPEDGVYERRHRRGYYSQSKPPRVVRKLLRSMQRTFASW